ncbi:endocuticle structural glycoprotein SgAbd-3-like [Bombyx mandarina]|uniref:Endocuticle structural glycoprotein SgAbd-3-like n=2 Tax=Bombyx TaxID=7090 RepID=A0A6J2JVX3_BOMMA|nr:cuticular protein RR-1 motif 52 [Bombyx mori]XP_028032349.1 endocuticle structural glycoprotein SgAbd-3-like [Bombyx mandarina]FAA00555.1 TPA: putative cuticle protein [Bombyx mori]
MNYLIIFALAAVAADRLDKDLYLPPHAGSSGGASAGLQGPRNSAGSHQALTGSQSGQPAEILRYDNEINEDGYHYAFETSDGTKAEQEGQVVPGAKPEEGSINVKGSFSYVGDDGQTYSVSYTADENGFRPEGAHLPTAPPIPEEILKSLQLTDTKRDQYSSQKSSYDADAGY